MVLQANIFLLLFGAIQGFLLSIALLSKRERHSSHVFLTLFLVVVGLQLTFKVVTKVWLMDNATFAYILSYYLPFLTGPAIYLFMRSRTRGTAFSKKDLLHAIPFLLQCVVGVFVYFRVYGVHLWLNVEWVRALAQLTSLAIYFWMSRKLIVSIPVDSSRTLRQFLNYVTFAEAVIIITLAVMVMYYGRIPDVRILFVLLTVVIYWITWKMMTDPDALTMPDAVSHTLEPQLVTRYAHSGLKDDEATRIETGLRKLMSNEKIFTDSKLTIDKLAGLLNTTRHHLSQVLNERIRRPYNEYISDLRLEEAQLRLSDPKSFRYTIASIALDSGFSTVSTFNEAFKKKFGMTPSAFRHQPSNQKSA